MWTTRVSPGTGATPIAAITLATASWQQMAERLHTPEGIAIYRERAKIIEPVFGQLFQRVGRTLNYRNDAADTELSLWAASHNLLKAFKEQTRHQLKVVNQPTFA
jgi:hypothetical protein